MIRSVRLLIVVLLLPCLLESSSIIGGHFSFTAGSVFAELRPSFLICRNSEGLSALFLQSGTTPMNGLSYWEDTLEEGRLGYFEYTVTEPLIYQGVYYPNPVLVYAVLDFFFGTLRAPASGGTELVFERVPVRLDYWFSIGNPWSEDPLDWTSFREIGYVFGSASGFARLRFFGEFVDDGIRQYWLYDLREASIDLVHTPEPETYALTGFGLVLLWLGRRFAHRAPWNSRRPAVIGAKGGARRHAG